MRYAKLSLTLQQIVRSANSVSDGNTRLGTAGGERSEASGKVQASMERMVMLRGAAKEIRCGASTLPQGVYYILSPYDDTTDGLPNNYNCIYSLKSSDVQGGLRLRCQQFSLEKSDQCTADYFQVEGFGRFCGTVAPPIVTARSLQLQVVTNDQGVSSGAYNCLILSMASGAGSGGLPCGRHVLKAGSYSLLSKNHPGKYEGLLYCGWQLEADNAADELQLSCNSFQMERPYRQSCEFDWLRVNGTRYCGITAPTVPATAGSLTVEYATDFGVHRSGFRCTVQVGTPSA